MPAETQLLFNLREFLILHGIARKPSVAGGGHPLWLDPRDGVPAPGEGTHAVEIDNDVVLGAFQVSGFPRAPYDATHLRTDAVDIWIRSRIAPLAYDVEEALQDVLSDKRQYMLGALIILESRIFRGLQRLGSDENGFIFTTQYSFERPTP
jgi:hypothetical protein